MVKFTARPCPFPGAGQDEVEVYRGLAFDGGQIGLMLCGEPDLREEEGPLGPSFFRRRARRQNHFRLVHQDGRTRTEVALLPTPENYTFVQRTPDGGWLLVRPRSEGPADRNAHLYDRHGRHASSFHAGDGIEDVQVTSSGNIWVSYFDEGVYSGQEPSAAGLVCLTTTGALRFRFPNDFEPVIDDCYALNAASDAEAWCYYYSDFPVVRIGKSVELVHAATDVDGARALAVGRAGVLLAGSYDDAGALHWLPHGQTRATRAIALDSEGSRLSAAPIAARGQRLLLTAGNDTFTIDLD